MAQIIGVTATKATLSTSLNRKSSDSIRDFLLKKIERLKTNIRARCEVIVRKYILRNPVIKNLINPAVGIEGFDLPAEFGLTTSDVDKGVKTIIDILIQTIDVQTTGTPNVSKKNVITRTKVNLFEESKYERKISSALTYKSKKKYKNKRKARQSARNRGENLKDAVYNIEWGKWLVNAKKGISIIESSIPNIKEFGISYDINSDRAGFSRSGRALMIRGNTKRRMARLSNFPYKFPRGAQSFVGRKNFVDQIFNNQEFQKEIKEAILKQIEIASRK